MKITIKDTEIEIKYTIRALFIYEQLSDKTFNPQTLTELFLFFYALILANKTDIQLTFNELIELCDNDCSLFPLFQNWLNEEFSKQNQFTDKSKKKVTKK